MKDFDEQHPRGDGGKFVDKEHEEATGGHHALGGAQEPRNPFTLIDSLPDSFRVALGPRPGLPGGAASSHESISAYLDRADKLALDSADNLSQMATSMLEGRDFDAVRDAMGEAKAYMELHETIAALRTTPVESLPNLDENSTRYEPVEKPDPTSYDVEAEEMIEIMDLLDDGRNMGGKLSAEVRQRIWEVLDDPTPDSWWGTEEDGRRSGGAHGIVVGPGTFGTLWQAVNKHTDYDVQSMSTGDEPVPTRRQLLDALRAATATAPAEYDEQKRWAESRKVKNDPTLGSHLAETQRRCRGHGFYPTKADRSMTPRLYETDGVPLADKTVYAHYFVGSADWYVFEANWNTGQAFGFVDLGIGDLNAEMGYIDLAEIEAAKVGPFQQPVERDLDWEPKRFGEIRP